MKTIFKYGLAYVKNKKLLVNRKKETNYFIIPGGQPKKGESQLGCLNREMFEEHRVRIIDSSLKYIGRFEDISIVEPNAKIVMDVYSGDIIGSPSPSSEIEEQRFIGRHDNLEDISPIIRGKIMPRLIELNLL